MSIVITGGTGFAGQVVAELYLKAGHAVFITGHEAPVPGPIIWYETSRSWI